MALLTALQLDGCSATWRFALSILLIFLCIQLCREMARGSRFFLDIGIIVSKGAAYHSPGGKSP
jgi:hypothetical protein